MTRPPAARRRRQLGFTLVELMVALGLSMILAIVLLKMQAALGQQRMRTSDISERDAELRAAMDAMTQDMSSAAYLFGDMTQPCDAIFAYNNGNYFVHHPVDAVPATNGAVMGFAPSLTLNYPTDTTPSDVLVLTSSTNAGAYNDTVAPQLAGDPSSGTDPINSGNMKLVVGSKTAPVAGHAALLEAGIVNPTTARTQSACFRVPVTAYNAATSTVTSTSGTTMPAGYGGFNTPLATYGFGTLGNGQLLAAPKFVDIGATGTTTPTQVTTAYYIACNNNNCSTSFPVLMKAQYDLTNDAIVQGTTPQQVAAGVVSLQVRFYDAGTTAPIPVAPAWLSAASVTAKGAWCRVSSVRMAIVTRSLTDDPDGNYTWSPTKLTPGTSDGQWIQPKLLYQGTYAMTDAFKDVPVATAMKHRRYLLQVQEIAARNTILANPSLATTTPTC